MLGSANTVFSVLDVHVGTSSDNVSVASAPLPVVYPSAAAEEPSVPHIAPVSVFRTLCDVCCITGTYF